MVDEHERPWKPLTVRELAAMFSGAPFFWCIAGGYAIEFAAGESIRPHGDIDLLVFRNDAMEVRHFLAAWDCWMADPPGRLRRWPIEEVLPPHTHDVWCRKDPGDDWRFQLMFDEASGALWQSRRSPLVSRRIEEIANTDAGGVRYLAPEIQLFYKAKQPRPKDEADFAVMQPKLTAEQRVWLSRAIRQAYGSDTPWLKKL